MDTRSRAERRSEKRRPRRFINEYKLRLLEEADRCTKSGELGTLLRRVGLYSSNLTTWRNQRRHGVLEALRWKRGPKLKRSAAQADLEKLQRALSR